ncbi:transporter substrate-binding domain-containing protein [Rhodobacterales bacterium HKCCE2091]|nr:transporter substrate-binding domain-containing protein [Rhodobacterales bacterium HKCCE2091]
MNTLVCLPRRAGSLAFCLGAMCAVLPLAGANAQDSYVVQTAGVDGLAANADAAALLPEGTTEITVVTFPNVPFTIVGEDGSLEGAGVDLSAAVAAVLGVELSMGLVNDVATSKVSVQSGRFDISTGPLIDTPDSERDFAIIPWLKTTPGFVFQAGRGYDDVMDFCGLRVAIVSGSRPAEANTAAMTEACEAAGLEAPTVSGFGGQDATVVAVLGGREDVALMGAPTALYMATVRPEEIDAISSEDDIFGVGLYSGLGMVPGEDGVSPAVLAALQVLRENGVYTEIMEAYGLGALAVDDFAINPITSN